MSDPTFTYQFGAAVQADILRQAAQDRRGDVWAMQREERSSRRGAGRSRAPLGLFGWRTVFARRSAAKRVPCDG
jgi:hypothetical protein